MKKLGNKSSGIYYIEVEGKKYVGKDHDINRMKRIKEHKNYLSKEKHYNTELQNEYNKNKDFKFGVLEDYGEPIDDSILCDREVYWISKLDSYNDGYNKTTGGIGMSGIIYSDEQIKAKSDRVTGDKNPMSKLSLDDFLLVVEMLENNFNNKEIAEKFGLHDRYISLIRNKKRHIKWFDEYAPSYEIVSGRKFQVTNKKMSDSQIEDINELIKSNKYTNIDIGKMYDVDASTISRIKSKIKKEDSRY